MLDSSESGCDDGLSGEEPPVSLCIAMTCEHENKPGIVLCCDLAGTRGDVQSEDIVKIRDVGYATVLLAGNMSNARELLIACTQSIVEYPVNGDDLAITRLKEGLTKAVKQRKRDVSTAVLSAELGLSWEEIFNHAQVHPNDPTLMEAWSRIKRLDLGAELVVCTFTDDEAAILVVEASGKVIWVDHYAAVGTGSQIASTFLHQRPYADSMPLDECLYRAVEAKMAAERNPYVGPKTNLEFRTSSEISFISNEYYAQLKAATANWLHSRPTINFTGDILDTRRLKYPAVKSRTPGPSA